MPNGPALTNPGPRVSQALGYDPTLPAPWTQPESVTDSSLTKAMRLMSKMLGTDDPAGQILGMAGAMDVPGAVGPLQKAVSGLVKRIRAYHGSPHDFDAFSLDKIGTGEGAQAYGHGLYFAENEKVAKEYRDTLSAPKLTHAGQELPPPVQGRDFLKLTDDQVEAEAAHDFLRRAQRGMRPGVTADDIVEYAKGEARVAAHRSPDQRDYWLGVEKRIDAMRPNLAVNDGRMYEVEINADPSDFLDWDKPLSQQSEKVKATLREMAKTRPELAERLRPAPFDWFNADGQAIYGSVVNETDLGRRGSMPYAERVTAGTNALQKAGISGIKYLDGNSRVAGEGTSNYVVFDDKLISILRKYGVAGAVGAGYTMQQIQQAQQEPPQ